jgi:hypothetical protein
MVNGQTTPAPGGGIRITPDPRSDVVLRCELNKNCPYEAEVF